MNSSQQTSELVSQLEPALTLYNGELPKAAIELAIAHQAESTPILLGYIEYALENLENLDPYYFGHLLALFILSQFRETKAFPLVLAICKLNDKQQETLLEDSLTEDLAKFIGCTFDGNLALLKQHIENKNIDFYARIQLLQSLFVLLNNQAIALAEVESYVSELFDKFIADNDKNGITSVVNFCLDFTIAPYLDKIQHAFELNLVDTDFITPNEIEHVLNANEVPRYLNARFYQAVSNTIDEISWWHCFQANNAGHDHHDGCCDHDHDHNHDHDHHHAHEHHAACSHDHNHDHHDHGHDDHHHHHHDGCCAPKTIQYNEPKLGRNDPCFCGSGKKFKKCCL